MNSQTNKPQSYPLQDKENKSEYCNSCLELPSQKLLKTRHNFISQQYLPQQCTHNNQAYQENYQLQNKTDETVKEIARVINADKVKRSLNPEGQEEIYSDNYDETQYNEIKKNIYNTQDIYKLQSQSQNNNQVGNIYNKQEELLADISNKQDIRVKEWKTQGKDENQVLNCYNKQILEFMMKQEKTSTPQEWLARHNIPINLRAKMIDWMIEVLSSYKCTEQTFFLAQRIMDGFFQKTNKVHEIGELHLVGVTSMFIACKYEEIYPMKLQVVHEKIAHKKLSIDQIKLKESDIVQTLNFELVGATPYELAMHALSRTTLKQTLEDKIYTYLQKICVYLCKMVLYDYELIANKTYALLSGALIFVAFKIIEQIDVTFKAEQKIKSIIKILNLQNDVLIETAAKVLNLAKNFDKMFPNLENLKKFNGFSLDDMESNKN